MTPCSILGCDTPQRSHSYCGMHWQRFKRNGDPQKTVRRRRTNEERFWPNVKVSDGCWEWQGARDLHGYGILLDVNWKKQGAHRVSWALHYGPIPAGMFVCHHCDNRRCCNPAHMFLGSIGDNMRDRTAKGRQARGSRIRRASLIERDAALIRYLADCGARGTHLAKLFGVSQRVVCAIRYRKTWAHVPDLQMPEVRS